MYASAYRVPNSSLEPNRKKRAWLSLTLDVANMSYPMGTDLNEFIKAKIREWSAVVEANPNDAETLGALGAAHGKLGDHAASLEYFQRAVIADPGCGAAYEGMAAAYGFLGRPMDKVHACRMAVAIDPSSPIGQANLGSALGKIGLFDEAVVALREAVRLAPQVADFRFGLGVAYLSLGDLDSARSEERILERIDSDNAKQLRRLIEGTGTA